MGREPAVIIGTLTGVAAAVVALVVAFGVDLSREQTAAILGVVAALAPVIAAVVTRSKVAPMGSVAALVKHTRLQTALGKSVPVASLVAGPAAPTIPDGTPVSVTREGG